MEKNCTRSASFTVLMPGDSGGCSTPARSSSADSIDTVMRVSEVISTCESADGLAWEVASSEAGELEAVSVFTETPSECSLASIPVLDFAEQVVYKPIDAEHVVYKPIADQRANTHAPRVHWTPGRLLEAAASSAPPPVIEDEEGQSRDLSLFEVVQAQDKLIAEIMARYEALEVEAFAMREQLVFSGEACDKQVPNATWVEGRKSHATQVAALRVKLAKVLAAQTQNSYVCEECKRRKVVDFHKGEARKKSRSPAGRDLSLKTPNAPKQGCNPATARPKQARPNSQMRSPRRQTMPCMSHRPTMVESGKKGFDHSRARGRTSCSLMAPKKKQPPNSSQDSSSLERALSDFNSDWRQEVLSARSVASLVAVGDATEAPQQLSDFRTMKLDALQKCPTKWEVTFDSRRIRSWSPPTEGRGLGYMEKDEASKWMPQAAIAECTRTISQPAVLPQLCTDMTYDRFILEKAVAQPVSLRDPPARISSTPCMVAGSLSEQPSSCTPPVQPHAGTLGGPAPSHKGGVFGHQSPLLPANGCIHPGMVGGVPSVPLCAGKTAAANTTSAVKLGCVPKTSALPSGPSTEQAPQQPLPLASCTSFKISAQGHNSFENAMAERSVSPALPRQSYGNVGKLCGGSLQVVVPCEAVARQYGGSLQVAVPCEIVRSR